MAKNKDATETRHAKLAEQFFDRYAAAPGDLVIERDDGLRTSFNIDADYFFGGAICKTSGGGYAVV